VLGDHVVVGPHAHLNGVEIGTDAFVATGASVFPGARVGARAEIRIGGIVHVNSSLPDDGLVPIGGVAVGDPAEVLSPDRHEEIRAIQEQLDLPGTVFGIERRDRARPSCPRSAAATPSCSAGTAATASSRSSTREHRRGRPHQLAVSLRLAAVAEHSGVLEAHPRPMAPPEPSLHHVPRGHAITVMNLLEGHARGAEHALHGGGVPHSVAGVRIQGLHQNPDAALSEPRGHKAPRVLEFEKAGLDAHAAADEALAELDDAGLALVGRDQFGQLGPTRDELQATARVRLDVRRGAQRDRNSGTLEPHRPQSCRAGAGGERLDPAPVTGVQVKDPRPGIHRSTRFRGELCRSPRDSRMLGLRAGPVQRGL
jgi:hypothetical protein